VPTIGATEAERPHWSERPWIRALRGGRGRPFGCFLLAVLVAALLGLDGSPLRRLRLACFDAYQMLLPGARLSEPTAIVIVGIDEPSLARYGQWPWPRTMLARLIARIAAARPAAIGIDILMAEPDRLSPRRLPALVPGIDPDLAATLSRLPSNDSVLANSLRGLPVVLAVAGLDNHEVSPPGRRPPVRLVGGDANRFARRFPAALRSVEEIDGAARGHGLISVDPEAGVVRRVPLVAAVAGALMPTFGLEMLRVAAGAPELSVRVGRLGIEAVGVGDLVVPTQPDGTVWVHFSPPDPTRVVSAADVLTGKAAATRFEGNLVLVGVTALGLSDDQATPVSEQISGVEIHAQLLEGMLHGDLLARPRVMLWAEAAVLAAVGLVLIVAFPALSVRKSTTLVLPAIALPVALGFLFYREFRILFDALSPAVGLGVLFTAMLGVTLAEADSQRRALRGQVERQREAAARVAGELAAARRIQMGILPSPATAFPGEKRFDLYAHLEPAREVGGDLYDFFALDAERVFLLIGDVTGKGVPASLFMAVSKALYKGTALRRPRDIGLMMGEANAEISRDNAEGFFVTIFAAVLDAGTGQLEYCNAGHDAPYLRPRGGDSWSRLAGGGGPPLCVVDGFPYAAVSYRMSPGETLCVVTDGVTEALSAAGEFYGRERLQAVLAQLPAEVSPEEVGEAIRRDVHAFAAGVEASDDVAILVLRWKGSA